MTIGNYYIVDSCASKYSHCKQYLTRMYQCKFSVDEVVGIDCYNRFQKLYIECCNLNNSKTKPIE